MRTVAAAMLALLLATAPASAASPAPASTASSSPAADCTDLVALLPGTLGNGLALSATPTVGVEGIDPDDLLDPFLASVGASRDDVCGVSLRSGEDPATGSAALLLRVRGAGPDLATTFAAALAARLRGYGQSVLEEGDAVGGRPVRRLSITASDARTELLIADATSDALLVTPSGELLEALLPWLPGVAMPSPSAAPGSSAGSAGGPAASAPASRDASHG